MDETTSVVQTSAAGPTSLDVDLPLAQFRLLKARALMHPTSHYESYPCPPPRIAHLLTLLNPIALR